MLPAYSHLERQKKTMHKKLQGLTAYFLLPLVFLISAYLLIWALFSPIIDVAVSVYKMTTVDADLTESEIVSTFKGSNVFSGTVKASEVTFPKYSESFGRVEIESIGVDLPLIFGDSDYQLSRGLCQYMGSSFPGMGSTILIGGHNGSFLYNLKNIQIGDKIKITTNYGVFTYVVTGSSVKENLDKTAYDLAAKTENLVLYTCYYGEGSFGLSSKRFFVYADFLSGPVVICDE
jgi:sortase A